MNRKTWSLLATIVILILSVVACQPMPAGPTPAVAPANTELSAAPIRATSAPAHSESAPSAQPTLLVYNTASGLLAGDLLRVVTVDDVQADLTAFPSGWPVVGVGTTNQHLRTGEMMPDGPAGDLHFWWADPNSPSQADVVDLGGNRQPGTSQFPFLGLAVGEPATAITGTLQNVSDVHAWLEDKLAAVDVGLAGVQLRGEFSSVQTTVSYNIPLTGLDLSGGYVGADYFRFGDYITTTWTINGVYAADPALQQVISTPGHPLHLHGYQPDTMLGGHVGSASALHATITIWPLTEMVVRRGHLP